MVIGQGHLFQAKQDHSPFDVVAWHGNYAPYKVGIVQTCTFNNLLFHLDTFSTLLISSVQSCQFLCCEQCEL